MRYTLDITLDITLLCLILNKKQGEVHLESRSMEALYITGIPKKFKRLIYITLDITLLCLILNKKQGEVHLESRSTALDIT